MLFITFLVSLFFAMLHFVLNNGKLFNIGTIFSSWWCVVLLVNIINPYEWYLIDETAKICIMIGVIALNMGFLLGIVNKPTTTRYESLMNNEYIVKKNMRLFYFIQKVLLIFMIPMVIKGVNVLLLYEFDMSILRDLYATGGTDESYMNTLQRLFYIHYIVGPCAFACVIYDVVLCFNQGFKVKPLVYAVLLSGCMTLYSAARTSLFFLAFMILACYLIMLYVINPENSDYKKMITKIRKMILMLVLVLGGVTILRKSNSSENAIEYIVRTLSTYFGGGIRVFSQTLKDSVAFGYEQSTYGMCTFAGLVSIYSLIDRYFLGAVGLNIFPKSFLVSDIVQGYLYGNIRISDTYSMNAFPTLFYYFFRDGGIIFLVLASVSVMWIFARIWIRYLKFNSPIHIFILVYFFYVVIMGVCWWEPMRCEFWMIMFWGVIIAKFVFKRGQIDEITAC